VITLGKGIPIFVCVCAGMNAWVMDRSLRGMGRRIANGEKQNLWAVWSVADKDETFRYYRLLRVWELE
jgi:hypothetical protein